MIEDHSAAVEDFNHVLSKNNKNAHAYFRRAFSLKAMKDFTQAAEDFERAKELDPMNPHMLINHKQLKNVKCIVLCEPGKEKLFI
jgi:Flp pilus assembly protein TadD